MLAYFSYSLCVENFYLAWDKYATILLKFTLRELLLNQLKLLNFVYLNVLSGVLKELFFKMKICFTMKSSLFVGAQVRGFRGKPLPTNLHPHEPIYNLLLKIYWNYSDDTTKEITSPRDRTILAFHEHWLSQIKMIPQYKKLLCIESFCFYLTWTEG